MEESEWTFWPTQYYHSALLTQFFWETNDIIKRKIVLYFKISIYRTKEKSRYKLSSEMLVISTVLIRVKCQCFNPLRRQNFYNFWKNFYAVRKIHSFSTCLLSTYCAENWSLHLSISVNRHDMGKNSKHQVQLQTFSSRETHQRTLTPGGAQQQEE